MRVLIPWTQVLSHETEWINVKRGGITISSLRRQNKGCVSTTTMVEAATHSDQDPRQNDPNCVAKRNRSESAEERYDRYLVPESL